jgi:hypothetical protein
MPSREIKISVPELYWEDADDGSVRFFADHEGGRFRATLCPSGDYMDADYSRGHDGGSGSYRVDSADDLARTLGGMLLYVAGLEDRDFLAGLARSSFAGNKLPACLRPAGNPSGGEPA